MSEQRWAGNESTQRRKAVCNENKTCSRKRTLRALGEA
jgi:hypothetical protein